MASPRVAVVLVNYNGRKLLPRCLGALRDQTRPADRVILVDNGSSDGSAELVRAGFPEVELVALDRNLGFAPANNEGVRRAADCDLVALLNTDAFAEPGWLELLVEAAERNPGYAAVASLMVRADDPARVDSAGDRYHVSGLAWQRGRFAPVERAAGRPGADEVFAACAGAALYRRGAWEEVGGFDESYFAYYEDNDLAFRLRLAGHGVWYEPRAVVRHVGSATAGSWSELSVYHGQRNMAWTWIRCMPWPLAVAYLPWHLAARAALIRGAALNGRARAALRGELDGLRGLPRILRERRRVQAARRASIRDLRRAMATGWDIVEALPSLERVRRLSPRARGGRR